MNLNPFAPKKKYRKKNAKGIPEPWVESPEAKRKRLIYPLVISIIGFAVSLFFGTNSPSNLLLKITVTGGIYLYLLVLLKEFATELTNNVKVNQVLSPVYFLLMIYILHENYNKIGWELLWQTSLSTFIYVYASHYFQPDLDVSDRRPGMAHFPLGKKISYFRFGRFLKWAFLPITKGWYYFWHPYGNLLTHRGIGHYPILGVWLRVGYLWGFYSILKLISIKMGFGDLHPTFFESWLRAFFPWEKNFLTIQFLLFNFPIYLSDSVHWLVDYYDSVKRGMSFCPPRIPRGLIVQMFNLIKGGENNEKPN